MPSFALARERVERHRSEDKRPDQQHGKGPTTKITKRPIATCRLRNPTSVPVIQIQILILILMRDPRLSQRPPSPPKQSTIHEARPRLTCSAIICSLLFPWYSADIVEYYCVSVCCARGVVRECESAIPVRCMERCVR